jgi:hypothetical protein
MQFYEYKGYTIYPTPHFAVESSCWSIGIVIKYNNVLKKYSNDNFFLTEGEAVFHSIQYGRSIIDQGIVLLSEAV